MKFATTVDGKPAVIDGTQPPLVEVPKKTLAECMKRLTKANTKVQDAKSLVKDAGQDLKDARAELDAAVESVIDAFKREGPGGQLSLDAISRIKDAAKSDDE